MATANDDEILEGFLCPICKADLKSASQLTNHFESLHQEDQDVLKSLKDIFGKAKTIILNNENADLKETFARALKFNYQDYYDEEQVIGVSRSSTDYFKGVRFSRLERYATETNKLLIRLDKLICNMPSDPHQRKIHEQDAVPWLDGSSVNLCPNCAKPFHLTRRQHHCRLCGSILCHDCSVFLDIEVAKTIINPSAPKPVSNPELKLTEKNGLRLCEHCYNLIKLRKQVQETRNTKTELVTAYEEMRSLMEQAKPAVAMYEKMCQSLFDGETTYNMSDVNAMRGRIGKLAEGIDLLSKQIVSFPAEPGTRQARLQNAIRQAAGHYIKEDLLSLRKLPTEAQIEEVRRQRYERAEKQIQMERERMERERQRREGAPGAAPPPALTPAAAQHDDDDDNPLLEQMNIIRGYIKEARQELRFEEIMSVSPSTGFPLEEEYKKNTGITPWEIAELRSWLETQPHMPSDVITDMDLILAHHSCKRNPEQTKQVLELHYTLKTQYSFFQNRTLDDEVELTLKRMLLKPLPSRTKDGYAVFYSRLLDFEPKHLILQEALKSVLMVLDLWQYLEGTWPGLVIIFDLEGFRLSHMFRLELQIVQQFLHYLEHAMLVQLKGIHLMNAPFFANRLLMILKRFVGSEMMHLVNTHTAGSNTLAEYVDVEILPKEAGGSFRSVEECRDDTIAMMKENKDFFLQENKKRVTESLRPKKSQNKKKPEKFLNID